MRSSYNDFRNSLFQFTLTFFICVGAVAMDRDVTAINTISSVRQAEYASNEETRVNPKILFYGNSITQIAPNEEIDWPNNWGMAASAESRDYVHLLVDALTESNGIEFEFMIKNGVSLEMNYANYNLSDLETALNFDANIVIIAIGENANTLNSQKAKDQFEKKLNEVILAFKQQNNPRIVIRSTFWAQSDRDAILKRVAEANNCIYVDLSHLVYDESNYARSERKYSHAGVAMHPGDQGMQQIADAIFQALANDQTNAINL
jgi:lysophospholipase L1-like esterase